MSFGKPELALFSILTLTACPKAHESRTDLYPEDPIQRTIDSAAPRIRACGEGVGVSLVTDHCSPTDDLKLIPGRWMVHGVIDENQLCVERVLRDIAYTRKTKTKGLILPGLENTTTYLLQTAPIDQSSVIIEFGAGCANEVDETI